MINRQKGFLLLDILSACALISLIILNTYTVHEHLNRVLLINKVRTAAELLARDLRNLQRYSMFQSQEINLVIKVEKNTDYRTYNGYDIKKVVRFADLGCDGVYFSKNLNTSRFMATGAPVYTGDYVLKHRDLSNFSCTLSVQPITGRVIISESK